MKRRMTETTYRVLNVLSDVPKSRARLAYEARVTDRTLREEIRTLRENGYLVCSNSQRGGYWIGTESDVARTAHELMKRGIALIRQGKMMMPVSSDGEQIEMKEVFK